MVTGPGGAVVLGDVPSEIPQYFSHVSYHDRDTAYLNPNMLVSFGSGVSPLMIAPWVLPSGRSSTDNRYSRLKTHHNYIYTIIIILYFVWKIRLIPER